MYRPVEILIVEDTPTDARLAREALMEGSIPKRIHLVTDGAQAIDFVRQRGEFTSAPRPDIVLLDLNLPKRDGMDVLREIKADPELRGITVIVLSTSSFAKDVSAAYEAAANCYVVKPLDYDEFVHIMRGIEEFWMRVASLPSLGHERGFSGDITRKAPGENGGPRSVQRPRPSRRRALPRFLTRRSFASR